MIGLFCSEFQLIVGSSLQYFFGADGGIGFAVGLMVV